MNKSFLRNAWLNMNYWLLSCMAMVTTVAHSSPNIIGFFMSYDQTNPDVWVFNNHGESIDESGYTVLIDAFWVNYPYCWGDGSGLPGKGSPIPECRGISNAPGPGISYELYSDFWNNFTGQAAPSTPGTPYNLFWTSLHTTGPQSIGKLRAAIDKSQTKPKLLASIGGWNMGGDSAGKPVLPHSNQNFQPAWQALLKNPDHFNIAMSSIMQIQYEKKPLYDGIDIDLETAYGAGCETSCTLQDSQKSIDNIVKAVTTFHQNNPNALLSISPRAADIWCDATSCPWNNPDGSGFVGQILIKLAKNNIYFDYINPQFYNDSPSRNIPNGTNALGNPTIGNQVASMLTHFAKMNILGPNTSLNIGVLAQTNDGQVDTGGASINGNPGVSAEKVASLWTLLNTDSSIHQSGLRIGGIMGWASNLALNHQGAGGNVRTMSSNQPSVVPFNWGTGVNSTFSNIHSTTAKKA